MSNFYTIKSQLRFTGCQLRAAIHLLNLFQDTNSLKTMTTSSREEIQVASKRALLGATFQNLELGRVLK